MLKQKLNSGWTVHKGVTSMFEAITGAKEEYAPVQLPHDAMIHEARDPNTGNGGQTGFWPGGAYTYKRILHIPMMWQCYTVLLEFEGVYETAMVYVNGNLAAVQRYGYSGFYVCLDKYIHFGDNEITVIANNDAEKNTRWYSGSGIYRNVNLLIGNRIYIKEESLKIATPAVSSESAVAEVEFAVKSLERGESERVRAHISLYLGDKMVGEDVVHVTLFPQDCETVRSRICVKEPALWDCDHPNLYRCRVSLYKDDAILDEGEIEELLDESDEAFGFRRVELDAERGLRINGKQVKLRGACIHHDNGILGAATFEKAEERRCRLLKAAGFNSVRSSHHPMSRAMLSACDKYGILVMDELFDMWTKHKNANDYAFSFLDDAEKEIRRMVDKDFNHPCVIIYSTGNEIPEICTARGAQINRRISSLLHELDPSRYTTCGINGMLALMSRADRVGDAVRESMRQIQGEQSPAPENDASASGEGADALNAAIGSMEGNAADGLACSIYMTETLEEACEAVDIIGLNYLTGRHEMEGGLHPNKTVVGTESYPADIARIWDIVERCDHVLGDFTWTGYDYLGEAGCGIFYYDGKQNFAAAYPDRLAYIGDIDIIGYRRPISYLREIVFGLRKAPYIAVERVDRYGMPHSKTAWMLKDNIASWTWPGYEGKPAVVDVYSPSDEVELFLNGKSLGRRPAGKACGYTATFEITYEPGELKAVAIEGGKAAGEDVLRTAGSDVELFPICEEKEITADGEDLAFVTVKLVDKNGVENLFAQKKVSVNVTGAGELAAFGSADPRAVASYDSLEWDTYNGYVMAAIRSNGEPGTIRVEFTADGCVPVSIEIEARKA